VYTWMAKPSFRAALQVMGMSCQEHRSTAEHHWLHGQDGGISVCSGMILREQTDSQPAETNACCWQVTVVQ
jgi:hypothetical protein